MKRSRIVMLVLFQMVIFGSAVTAYADTIQYSFSPINIPGAFQTIPAGINNLDQIVGIGDLPIDAFLYSGGGYTTFSFPGGTQTEAHGINDSGQIVGEYVAGGAFHGFVNNVGSFSAINFPGAVGVTQAFDISDSGQIVGDFFDGTEYHGFLDSGGSFTPIAYPGAVCSNGFSCGTFATGINDNGQIVGYFGDPAGVTHGFLYSNGTFTIIDDPNVVCPPQTATLGCGTFVTGINDSGQTVGRFMVPIPDSGGGFALTNQGFLQSGGTFITIDNPNNPDNTFLLGINDSSQIVGSFVNPGTGFSNGFLATPGVVPEPRTLPAFAACLICLAATVYRRKRA